MDLMGFPALIIFSKESISSKVEVKLCKIFMMTLEQIEAALQSDELQERLKAITALRNYDADSAIPLLMTKKQDSEFLVRSFVAMGLGQKRSADTFATLLEMLSFDKDSNVRAESANSLSLFGSVSIPHLVKVFHQDDNWLVRSSILAALAELDCPRDLLDVCICGIEGEDLSVQDASVSLLGMLAETDQKSAALTAILAQIDHPSWRIRRRVALSLQKFDDSQTQIALEKLKNDEDYRVVGASLEKSLEES